MRRTSAGLAQQSSVLTGSSAPVKPLRVVYVAGSGHTGSTLLALLLDEHPQIVSVGETAVKPRIRRRGRAATQQCSCGATVSTCGFWKEIFARVQQSGYSMGPDRWINDYRSEHPLVHRLLTRESSFPAVAMAQRWLNAHLPVHAARMRQADATNVAFVRAALDIAHADVFCDTTKHTLRLARLLANPELDVRVIMLVRDARGYVSSAKRRGYRIEDAAWTWRRDQEVVARLTRDLPTDRCLLLKYEALCTDLEPTLRRLHAFCGVSQHPPVTSMRSDTHHVLGNSMRLHGRITVRLDESWRRQLSADEQQAVATIAGALNSRFGYD
jgi:hypothetical protein